MGSVVVMGDNRAGMVQLLWLAAMIATVACKQILYQPDASETFVAHKELPFTVQYAGNVRNARAREFLPRETVFKTSDDNHEVKCLQMRILLKR